MDAADLRVFETVCRLGGMNRAAEALHTVQSNVTARIRALEAELGQPLFERHARGVTPTAAGERLLPYARDIRQMLAEAAAAVRDDGTPRGPLLVGSLETTAALRLSPVLARYAAAWPEVDVTLRTGTSCELVEDVLAGRLEGAFVCGPVRHGDLTARDMFSEELVLLTPPGVDGAEALHGLSGVRILVLRAGCSYRQRLEEALARRGVVGLRRLEFGTLDAIIGCVAAGLGVTLLPRGIAEDAAGSLRIHALPPQEAMVTTQFIHRRSARMSSALRAFLDLAGDASSTAVEAAA